MPPPTHAAPFPSSSPWGWVIKQNGSIEELSLSFRDDAVSVCCFQVGGCGWGEGHEDQELWITWNVRRAPLLDYTMSLFPVSQLTPFHSVWCVYSLDITYRVSEEPRRGRRRWRGPRGQWH